MLTNKESQRRIHGVQDERLFKVTNAALRVAFYEQVSARVQKTSEQVEVLASKPTQHPLDLLLELLVLACLFVMFGDAVTPERFELAAFDRSPFGQVLDQRVKHRVIIESAGCLTMNQ